MTDGTDSRPRRLPAGLVPFLVFLAVAGLPFLLMRGGEPEAGTAAARPAAPAAGTLVVLSTHNRDVKREYDRAFPAWLAARGEAPLAISWLDVGGASKMLKDLETRFKADPATAGVDLLFGGGVDPFLRAAAQGWLAPVALAPTLLADLPADIGGIPLRDASGRWYGVALSGFGIIVNHQLAGRTGLPAVRDWADLARPEYLSWVGSGDPRSSGSVHMCFEIMLQAKGFRHGWPLVTRLCANVRAFGESGGTAPREVMSGEVAAGLVIDQYAQRAVASLEEDLALVGRGDERPLELVLPAGATTITPDPVAMLRGAPHPRAATLFMAFALSDAGQRLLFQRAGRDGQGKRLFRMPVRTALYADADAPRPSPYDFRAGFRYDDAKGSRRWKVLNDLLGCWCIDAHADLVAAWRAIVAVGAPEDLAGRLGEPPLAEPDLDVLAGRWSDARFRQETKEAWARQARERYRGLQREAGIRREAGRIR